MKRFYKLVSVYETQGGFGIGLDGRPVKTSAGKTLLCPSRALADEVMLEWSAQQDEIKPSLMPVNQLVMTALDRAGGRERMTAQILDYTDTDLVYYRSDSADYKARQEQAWDRFVRRAEEKFTLSLAVTDKIESLAQDKKLHAAIRAYLDGMTEIELSLFQTLVEETSSVILTLAFFEGEATPADLYDAVFVEEMLRAEIYLEDVYGAAPDQEKKRASVKTGLEAAEKVLSALKK